MAAYSRSHNSPGGVLLLACIILLGIGAVMWAVLAAPVAEVGPDQEHALPVATAA